jgi:hypothetical protein
MDYTVIGDEVNTAQRFESNAGPGQILITGNTYERIKGSVQVRDLGALRVKCKNEGVTAYDVLGVVTSGRRVIRRERVFVRSGNARSGTGTAQWLGSPSYCVRWDPPRAGQQEVEEFTPEYRETRSFDARHSPHITAPDSVKRGQWLTSL